MFALYNEMVIKEKERLSLCCTVPMMFVFFFSFPKFS